MSEVGNPVCMFKAMYSTVEARGVIVCFLLFDLSSQVWNFLWLRKGLLKRLESLKWLIGLKTEYIKVQILGKELLPSLHEEYAYLHREEKRQCYVAVYNSRAICLGFIIMRGE